MACMCGGKCGRGRGCGCGRGRFGSAGATLVFFCVMSVGTFRSEGLQERSAEDGIAVCGAFPISPRLRLRLGLGLDLNLELNLEDGGGERIETL